ncbi:MutT/nudix family protein [Aspergillus fischeri NRRL 181]|uniref:MutT/nudix family protein n=1 Tax=Neosartorya fischeri (strain ATCC 1020 / DSM 3700 / CBS 544.65 / FGSC A1164 / JCM 1740 / NRRL 181 / WB 181) TaxID=331117 RepID=A1DF07_NEOFI|nr:MutT/nudix family protein [Aspergillus fischeri NRRL 181]EAW17964.1 MutT/nudix family protein [Aspergillus fischeri NRRL 181]
MSGSDPKYAKSKFLSRVPLENSNAKWTRLILTTYTDPNGVERTWESAERQTRPPGCEVDGVGIVTIIDKPTGPELLLQKQYRPPIDKVVIEVPAGLIDAGETVEECAVRELREETGYVGVAEQTSTLMFNGITDPGMCNTNLNMVHVRVDLSLPENKDPKPQLEDNEFIECFTLPLSTLFSELKRLEAEGYAIDARVGTLAEGIELAKKLKL